MKIKDAKKEHYKERKRAREKIAIKKYESEESDQVEQVDLKGPHSRLGNSDCRSFNRIYKKWNLIDLKIKTCRR